MLIFGQERSRENAALTAEPGCASNFSWARPQVASSRKEFQAHTTTASGGPCSSRPPSVRALLGRTPTVYSARREADLVMTSIGKLAHSTFRCDNHPSCALLFGGICIQRLKVEHAREPLHHLDTDIPRIARILRRGVTSRGVRPGRSAWFPRCRRGDCFGIVVCSRAFGDFDLAVQREHRNPGHFLGCWCLRRTLALARAWMLIAAGSLHS